MALKYNKRLDKIAPSNVTTRLFINKLYLVQIGGHFYQIEPFIFGKIEKYSNNDEYLRDDLHLLSAWCHFSFWFTNKKCMVTDLEGEKNLLTDVSVHSLSKDNFGKDNGVQGGIDMFFKNHTCNSICKSLRLDAHPQQNIDKPVKKSKSKTAFTNNLKCKPCDEYFCSGNTYTGNCALC